MPKKGVLRGSKISSRHSTVIEPAESLVAQVKRIAEVRKVVLGPITPLSGGPMRIKIQLIPAGLKVTVRGPNSQQVFFFYTQHRSLVQRAVETAWEELRR